MSEEELIAALPGLTDKYDISNWIYYARSVCFESGGVPPALLDAIWEKCERTAASGTVRWIDLIFLSLLWNLKASAYPRLRAGILTCYPLFPEFKQAFTVCDFLARRFQEEFWRGVLLELQSMTLPEAGRRGLIVAWEMVGLAGEGADRAVAVRWLEAWAKDGDATVRLRAAESLACVRRRPR